MTLRHTLALSFAALLAAGFSASAGAATTPRHAAHSAHAVASHGRAAPATGADHSADQLNAQSLSRAQGATQ